MILDILRGNMGITEALLAFLLVIPSLLLSLTLHEVSHGCAAYLCGDPTARNLGRLSLNPLKHLDPIGTAMMLLFGFGYAKPVPVVTRNFKKPRRDMVLVALAGPLANFILGFIGTFFFLLNAYYGGNGYFSIAAHLFLQYFTLINIGLGVFNLIPIPPLDGSRLLTVLLPPKAMMFFFNYERYIQLAVFALLWLGVLDSPLIFLRSAVANGFVNFWSLLPIFR